MDSPTKKRLTNKDSFVEKILNIHQTISKKFKNEDVLNKYQPNYDEQIFEFCKNRWKKLEKEIDLQISNQHLNRLNIINSNIDEFYKFVNIFIKAIELTFPEKILIELIPHFLCKITIWTCNSYKSGIFMKVLDSENLQKQTNRKKCNFEESKLCVSNLFVQTNYNFYGSHVFGKIARNKTLGFLEIHDRYFEINKKYNEDIFEYLKKIECDAKREINEAILEKFLVETIHLFLHSIYENSECMENKDEYLSKFIEYILCSIFSAVKDSGCIYDILNL